MVVTRFPPVQAADEEGLLAVGGDVDIASVLLAYRSGIFPWPLNGELLAWFAPPERAVLFLDEFHIPQRLKRSLKQTTFSHRRDHDFRRVIARCAEVKNRGAQDGTWITSDIIESYNELFHLGYCHTFETYLGDELVGGIYGIQIGRFFAAESSFYRIPNASKFSMCEMVSYLRDQGISWFDCQVLTPFSETFGAREIPREDYMELLTEALKP